MASSPAPAQTVQRTWLLLLLSLSHAVVDVNTGSVLALLPVLRSHFNLNYTLVGSIILFAQLTSSLTQPFFGVISDYASRRWLLIASPLLAGAGVAAMGFTPSYGWLLAAVVLSSLGTAAFHPEGAHAAYYLGGQRRVRAMSLYTVGGNAGYGFAPLYIGAFLALSGGLRGTAWATVVPVALALLVWRLLPTLQRIEAEHPTQSSRQRADAPATNWYGLILLTGVTMLRYAAQLGVNTYITFYWIDILGHSPNSGRYVLFLYLMAGVAGTLLGAPLADRIGHKQTVVGSLVLLIPFQFSIVFVRGWPLLVVLFFSGFLVVAAATVTLVMSQDYAPRNLGLASGLNLGLAFGFAGAGTVLLGMLADRFGVVSALWGAASVVPVAMLLSFLLPPTRPPQARA